jgi:hypothetical protein
MSRDPEAGRRHLLLSGALAGLALAVLAGALALAAGLARYFQMVDYPGAARLSDHTAYGLSPTLALRRTTSYRTRDPFVDVYRWYSVGFSLGPEQHAQSNCILMARSAQLMWLLELETSVMLCDTAGGRMVFVMRSLAVGWR